MQLDALPAVGRGVPVDLAHPRRRPLAVLLALDAVVHAEGAPVAHLAVLGLQPLPLRLPVDVLVPSSEFMD